MSGALLAAASASWSLALDQLKDLGRVARRMVPGRAPGAPGGRQ